MSIKINSAVSFGLNVENIEIEINAIKSDRTKFSYIGVYQNYGASLTKKIYSIVEKYGIDIPLSHYIINVVGYAGPTLYKKTLDLPILTTILIYINAISSPHTLFLLRNAFMIGEVGLDGTVLPTSRALALVYAQQSRKIKSYVIPSANRSINHYLEKDNLYGLDNIQELVTDSELTPLKVVPEAHIRPQKEYDVDYSDVVGLENAKYAMQIVAAGGHNIFLFGSPGTGS
jgi:magnesium chelatase family protein